MSFAISGFALISSSFAGSNGVGGASAPGLKVGDEIIRVRLNNTGHQDAGTFCEATVSVDDELQQLDPSNLSGDTISILALRVVT